MAVPDAKLVGLVVMRDCNPGAASLQAQFRVRVGREAAS